jgi:hypothetical protein
MPSPIVVWLAVAASLGIAQPQPAPSTIPPALGDTVTAFWTAWKSRDLPGMYGFYCREYQSRVPREEYLKLQRLVRYPILEFSLTGAGIDGPRATVTVHARNEVPGHPLGSMESDTPQVWLMTTDGRWCKEDEPLLVPFPGVPQP